MTEEAFLLRSLKEIVNIWSGGSGQATFNFVVQDGVASLQLGFQLGRPADPHILQQDSDHVQTETQPDDLTQEHAGWQQQRRRRRYRGPAQRARNRARAAAHQASYQQSSAAVPAVVLPFTGKLLPVKKTMEKVTEPVTTPAQSRPLDVSARPNKATNNAVLESGTRNVDSAKKALFPPCQTPAQEFLPSTKSPHTKLPPSHPPSNPATTYKMKEDELWSRLFTT